MSGFPLAVGVHLTLCVMSLFRPCHDLCYHLPKVLAMSLIQSINVCVYAKQLKCPVNGLLELSTMAYAILILPAVVTCNSIQTCIWYRHIRFICNTIKICNAAHQFSLTNLCIPAYWKGVVRFNYNY